MGGGADSAGVWGAGGGEAKHSCRDRIQTSAKNRTLIRALSTQMISQAD